MTVAQLTIDGGEVSLERSVAARVLDGGGNGRAVLRLAVEQGGLISSTQAGRVVHRRRRERTGYSCEQPLLPGAQGCCRWCASDGGDVLKRLAELGLIERVSRGLWAVLEPGERPRRARFVPRAVRPGA